MGTYNIHGGHNPQGKVACGASGFLDESREDRLICKEVVRLLKLAGHTAYDCTCNNGKDQGDVLKKIVAKCNKRSATLDVSIHLNSGRNDRKGDGKIAGVEVLCTSASGIKKDAATRIRRNMKKLGFTDRGTKTTNGLYYLNHTKNKAILIEACFVDDKDDYGLYRKKGYKVVAKAIAEGIIGGSIPSTKIGEAKKPPYSKVKKTSGDKAIKWLQKQLNTCYTGKLPDLSVDGIWGKKTQDMLEAYWKQLDWKKGSYAGKKTCIALHKNRKK